MHFIWPWVLPALALVAAVALWAFFRPGRQLVVVASLAMWRRALERLGRTTLASRPRVTASWLLLLAGAALAVMALARPASTAQKPIRRVAFAVYPGAELAGPEGTARLRQALAAALARLDDADQVQLLLPPQAKVAPAWLSAAQARQVAANISPLPVESSQLATRPAPADAQHVYVFTPAVGASAAGPSQSVIAIPSALAPVTIDALGATAVSGKLQVLLGVRNWSAKPSQVTARVQTSGAPADYKLDLAPGERKDTIAEMPTAGTVAVTILDAGGKEIASPFAQAFLARRQARPVKVALLGEDEPLLRRFVRVSGRLVLVGSAADADLAICIGVDAPAGKPALLFAPPSAPPGWSAGKELANLPLSAVQVAADDPLMQSVNLARVAVYRAKPWEWSGAGRPPQRQLVTYRGAALVLADAPQGPAAPSFQEKPPRIYVAFVPGAENSNFAMTDAFVIFLQNAMDFLAPAGEEGYVAASPMQAGSPDGLTRTGAPPSWASDNSPLPWPGLYTQADGKPEAVSLVGAKLAVGNFDAAPAASALTIPAPAAPAAPTEHWPLAALLALVCWLAGWAMRLRQ